MILYVLANISFKWRDTSIARSGNVYDKTSELWTINTCE